MKWMYLNVKCSTRRTAVEPGENSVDCNGSQAMTYFSKVENAFTVQGRGCVIVPAAPLAELDFRLHPLDPIQLRSPDGEVLDTHIVSIELVMPVDRTPCRMAFLLPKDVKKAATPTGTEIWLKDKSR